MQIAADFTLHAQAYGAGVDQEEHWYAQLRLMFSRRDATGAVHRLAFLRWLRSMGGADLLTQRLTWATQEWAGGPQRPWYDCQDIDCIEPPVLLQQDPGHDSFFHYKNFMRCGTGHPLPAPATHLLQSPCRPVSDPFSAVLLPSAQLGAHTRTACCSTQPSYAASIVVCWQR